MKKYGLLIIAISFIFLMLFSFNAYALPKINITHDKTAGGIPKIQVTNETALTLACYVAIDGYKKKFILMPFKSSKWYSAISKRYDHTSFRPWCDSIEFYPQYEKYRL